MLLVFVIGAYVYPLLLSLVYKTVIGVSLHMTIGYAIERYIAMKNLETYEQKYSNNRLSLWLLTSTLTSVLFEATIFYWRILPDWLPFVAAYTISFIGVLIAFQMWMTIFLEPSLKKRFLSLFRKAPITSNGDLRNVLGKKIKYNNVDESNLYFKQLEQMWN
ncbi:unnamed protein product, partial [Mesorhabditis belari]|uniref:Uncharacterized protein n=1 Tax=Mesorhabditis belari TaxID=2138241 RepID=A0AAF3EZU9_9BILA